MARDVAIYIDRETTRQIAVASVFFSAELRDRQLQYAALGLERKWRITKA